MERESVKQLKDFHRHQPLVLNDEPWDEIERTSCEACLTLVSGERYSCADAECKYFHLHKRCAEAPSEQSRLWLHSKSTNITCCLFCSEFISGRWCYFSDGIEEGFAFCMKCALFVLDNSGEDNEKLKLDFHPHPLVVVANHKDEMARIECDACGEALLDSICVCFDCGLFLHNKCTDHQLPHETNHPCHRRHPLLLDLKKKFIPFCEICKQGLRGLSYGCSSCRINIHLKCAALGSFNNIADETHQHTFNFLWRQGSFICDACGDEGHYTSYVCSTCHINVHKQCTSLPPLIRVTRHPDHTIYHNYFVKENGLHQCKICYEEVEKEYGRYSCSKENCDYIFHVKCALVEGNYRIVNKDEAEDPVMESFQIIERNDNGEAVKIQHFSHEHYLILGDEINEGEDKCCDGCILFLSGLFYYCSQCDFFLHKTCAELPRKKYHWFHQHLTTLELQASISLLMRERRLNQEQATVLRCHFCLQWGSGLFYYCYECNDNRDGGFMIVCLRCASLPDALVLPGHEHLIFFDSKCRAECIGCGKPNYGRGAFRCKQCEKYGLDFNCLTLPFEARHKYDKHLLRLVHRDENDDPEKHYCDVCEDRRDPNRWFYFCSICDNSVHPECVLGKDPFIKIGSSLMGKDVHPHPLITFVKKDYHYPECSECGKPCVDLALECAQSECNYIAHFKHLSHILCEKESLYSSVLDAFAKVATSRLLEL